MFRYGVQHPLPSLQRERGYRIMHLRAGGCLKGETGGEL
ncbi:Uncharacterized protein dnm_082670 [Desulfonema magnum]|uniref:Uncharacterized protein n=1 Tax=Desulfonema magnum TaxID=45655 RepID=A0A975BUV7_9BACT|nr:Uncharacterized protein dnm_082670 [Desulfonema magnum]